MQDLPQRFGEFVLFDKIGQGGMAEIFLGKALGTLGQQRLTVIKRVLPLLSADPQFAEMLVQEAKLCAALSHKNVVQVTDLGRVDDQLYIAMEYVEGFDLNDLLLRCTKAKVPLPAEFIFLIMEEVLRALDYAHRATDVEGRPLGIIHRDVSPTNVLISCEGEVKLCDFGIARAAASEGTLPEGVLKGKFAYMSPEQARGDSIDQRADIFAAGILLWELISGHRLYRGDADEVLAQAQRGEAPPLPDRGLPNAEELDELVSRALSPNPDDRFQTAREMLAALGGYVQSAGFYASQLKFAEFLRVNFGDELQRQRRERERASTAPPPPRSVEEQADDEPEPFELRVRKKRRVRSGQQGRGGSEQGATEDSPPESPPRPSGEGGQEGEGLAEEPGSASPPRPAGEGGQEGEVLAGEPGAGSLEPDTPPQTPQPESPPRPSGEGGQEGEGMAGEPARSPGFFRSFWGWGVIALGVLVVLWLAYAHFLR